MGRNLKKEYEWRKNKYTKIVADVDKQKGEEFKNKLKVENKTVAGWITEQIEKYLDE